MPRATWADEREFLGSFLIASDEQKREYEEEDREALENVLVIPYANDNTKNTMLSGSAVLKDPETHIDVETLLATHLLSTIGPNGFASAKPVGVEDAYSAEVASALLENAFRRPNAFRTMYVSYKDALIFGATVVMPSWIYREGIRPVRRIEIDQFTGQEKSRVEAAPWIFQDDIELVPIGVEDFFPDPGHESINQMLGAARRFVIPKYIAMEMVEEGRWDREATMRALAGSTSNDSLLDDQMRESLDRPQNRTMPDSYEPVVGYEWWGETPYLAPDGQRRRRMVMLNGELVESRPSPVATTQSIPMYDLVISPIRGRWRGISPAKVNKYMQSFADAMLMVAADGAAKRAMPPIIYDENAGINPRQLKNWKGPIRATNINGVRELNWDADIGAALEVLSGLKGLMQQSSAATIPLQGGQTTKRQSATESELAAVRSMSRPEMQSELFEREYLPALGKGIFEMYQLFIESSADLARRVGESKIHPERRPFLGDIQGEYDIEFVGSKRIKSKEMQMQFFERAFQVFGSIPGAAPMFPWAPALAEWVSLMDVPQLESLINSPEGVEQFVTNSLIAQGGAAGNGASVANPGQSAATGLQPAQAAGRAIPA